MRRLVTMLCLLLALGLCTSVLVAWAGALVDRSAWPDTLLTGEPIGSRTEMRCWLVEEGRDRTLTWRTFNALDLWDEPPDMEAHTELPAWSVGHELPDQPGPFAPARERTRDMAWEVSAGWPMRCVRAVRTAGPTEFALPGEFVRGGFAAMAVGWPAATSAVAGAGGITIGPWPVGGLTAVVPLRPMPVGLLVNTVVFAGMWFVVLLPSVALRAVRRWRRGTRNRCTRCGHARDGLPEGAPCAECGREPDERTTIGEMLTARAPMFGAAMLLALVLASSAALITHRWMAVDRLPPLHHAAAVGDVERIERLIAAGTIAHEPLAELDSISSTMAGTTALHWAVSRGERRASLHMLELGAVLSDGSFAAAPLVAAVIRGDTELAESLAATLPDATPPGTVVLALPAADAAMRRWVLERFDWDPARLDAAAHSAIEAHEFSLIELLIEAGLDPRRRESRRLVETAILQDGRVFDGPCACDAGVTRALLALGFDQTPGIVPRMLFEVLRTDNVPAFDAMIGGFTGPRGATVYMRDGTLHVAAGLGHARMVRRLLAHGLDIDATDEGGISALDEAITFAHPGVVRVLLEEGADPRFDSRRHNALTRAEMAHRIHENTQSSEIVTLLEAAEAEWSAIEQEQEAPGDRSPEPGGL